MAKSLKSAIYRSEGQPRAGGAKWGGGELWAADLRVSKMARIFMGGGVADGI